MTLRFNLETHKRLIKQAIREASTAIRQVEIPKSDSPAPKKKSDGASAPKKKQPETNVKSKAKPTKKVQKKSVKDVAPPKKKEHIEGDSNKISFEQQGQQFTGWIEKRGPGKFDIIIVKGEYSVVKSVTEDDVAERVKAAAAKMISGKGSKSQRKKSSDVLLPPTDVAEAKTSDWMERFEKEYNLQVKLVDYSDLSELKTLGKMYKSGDYTFEIDHPAYDDPENEDDKDIDVYEDAIKYYEKRGYKLVAGAYDGVELIFAKKKKS